MPVFRALTNRRDMDKRISYLKEIFLSDLSYPWTVAEMARRVNISVSHLNRLFKAEFDLSPTQYLQKLRLERAADLLESSSLGIKEIRYCTGFSDKSVFIKKFKKKYGMLPLDYRKQSGKAAKAEKKTNFFEKGLFKKITDQMRKNTTFLFSFDYYLFFLFW